MWPWMKKKVSQSYGMVSYNGSRAALVDENGKIISSTDSEYLETIRALPRSSATSWISWRIISR